MRLVFYYGLYENKFVQCHCKKKSASKRTGKVQNDNKNFLIRNDFSVAFKVSIFARSDTF